MLGEPEVWGRGKKIFIYILTPIRLLAPFILAIVSQVAIGPVVP